ncbi:MAG: hypothetical protein JRI23_26485 [Deltaproteobacteria bacterium]|jgi:hypothetical protein|nr:hypothetical protein [Deltaproteobacteria bacterium]MBW2535584.1 hypothetical protein [Deltaproteobacteria bacterium]
MSLVVAAIAAASVGLAAGAVAVGSWLRRRRRRTEASCGDGGKQLPAAPPPRDDSIPLGLGDMVQVEDETRWLCSGVRIGDGATTRCALWFAIEGDGRLAVLAFAPPERHIYWLERVDLAVPAHPPSRLDVEGRLLDRVATFPAELEAVREPPIDTSGGVVSWYEGAVGDVAVTLHGSAGCGAFAGRRIAPDDFDRMGTVAPEQRDPPIGSAGAA